MADVANMLQKGCRRGCTACGRLWCPPYSTFACDQPSSWLSSTDWTTPTIIFSEKDVSLHFSYIFPTCFLHVSYIFTPFFSHIFSLHCSDLRPGAVWNSSWPRRLVIFHGNLLGYTVDGPAKSKSPVENGGLSDPMIYKVSTILLVVQDFATIYCSSIRWCYNHWNEHVFS